MLKISDFEYHLPPKQIAQFPAEPRDTSKLLVVSRVDGQIQDKDFLDLADLLTSNDVLVLNNTKVFPARLFVKKGNKHVELLLEKEVELTKDSITFSALTKPGLNLGDTVEVPHTDVQATCVGVEGYTRRLEFNVGREQLFSILETRARIPIPPYIKWNERDESELRKKYQTVFAEVTGAIAAPTAGLHFTKELLKKIQEKGVRIEYVTLHVGLGTFLPVKVDDITEHHMHGEWFRLDELTTSRLNKAKLDGKRIIAVGTTVVRVLETCTTNGELKPQSGLTQIFIYPPYQFKFVDSLITNFHMPKSTLLMLISAFASRPNCDQFFRSFLDSLMGKTYQYALAHNYRFYSFGDAMWII